MAKKEKIVSERTIEPPTGKEKDAKYLQFEYDLALAIIEGDKASERVVSGGFDVNFFSCLVHLPRWRAAKIKAICEGLGVFAQKCSWEGPGWWSISPSYSCGIGRGRMAAAEAMVHEMRSRGYEVMLEAKMD